MADAEDAASQLSPILSEANDPATEASEEGILYAAIASWEQKKILVDFTNTMDTKGISQAIVKESILGKLGGPSSEPPPGKCAKYAKEVIFYSSFPEGFSIIVLVTENYQVKHSLAFQRDVSDAFKKSNMPSDSPCPQFKDQLKHKVITFTTDPPVDGLDAVKMKQQEVKQVILENIDDLMKRHGLIEITAEQSDALRTQSEQFAQSSKNVRKAAECAKYKMWASIVGIIIIILAILIAIICATIPSHCS